MHNRVNYFALSIFLATFVAQVQSEKCILPDKKEGECTSLYSCLSVGRAILSQNKTAIEYVRRSFRSNCGGTATDPKVCCGLDPKVQANNSRTTKNTTKDPLPDRRYCGYQHSDDYFHSDNNIDSTSLDEFPWLAFLVYADEDGNISTTRKCNGVLISKRYVLTTESCIQRTPYDSNLVGVRLGENDITKDTDCIENFGMEECNLPIEEFGIEDVIPYSGANKVESYNTIALLRLNGTVEFSDYIRPICLPQPSAAAKIGDTLVIALEYLKKGKVSVELLSNAECKRRVPSLNLTENHLCTRDLVNEHSKMYVAGGPLMFATKNQWQLEGVLDVSAKGFEGHFKIANYIDWIRQNVKL